MEIRFPNKLRLYRRMSGYSQKKIARMLGLADTSTISRWEHGVAFPSIMQTLRLSRIYRTEPLQLFDELWHQVGEEYRLLARDDEEPFSNNSERFYM